MGISIQLVSYSSILPNVPVGMTPNIIEERQMNIAVMDVFSRLMMDRIIFLGTGYRRLCGKYNYSPITFFRVH